MHPSSIGLNSMLAFWVQGIRAGRTPISALGSYPGDSLKHSPALTAGKSASPKEGSELASPAAVRNSESTSTPARICLDILLRSKV